MAFKMKGFPYSGKSPVKNYNKMSKYSSKAVKFGEDEVDPAFKQTIEGEDQETWEPAWPGGDWSWEDLEKMGEEEIRKRWPDEADGIMKDLASRREGGGPK